MIAMFIIGVVLVIYGLLAVSLNHLAAEFDSVIHSQGDDHE